MDSRTLLERCLVLELNRRMASKANSDDMVGGPDHQDVEGDDRRTRVNRERNKEHARKTRIRKKEQLQALKNRVSELEEEGKRLKQRIKERSVASILLGLASPSTSSSSGGGAPSEGDKDIHGASSHSSSQLACLEGKQNGLSSSDGEDPSPPPEEENIKGRIKVVHTPSNSTSSSSLSQSNYGACLTGKRKRFLSLDGEDPSPPPMELIIKGQITLVGGPSSEGKTQINWKTGVYVDQEGKRQKLTKTELEELR